MTRTRQEIYDSIRASSKTQFIFDDMVRLGFWGGEHPSEIAGRENARRKELRSQLQALRTEQSRLRNTEALLKEARKRRMAESRANQQETKARRERERQARAEAWRQRQSREILYLGDGVSNDLDQRLCDEAVLAGFGLPKLTGPEDIAAAMGIAVSELRFLAYSRKTSSVSHYVRFKLPKKTGGHRLISAPMPRLKKAQRWILDALFQSLPYHDAAHGFRPGRSIVSNAAPHTGADVVVNLDLKDFFPTLTFKRVRGVFRSLGFSASASTTFALLCTEPETEQVELDGRVWNIALGERFLPQGAPTSPAITNWACRQLDLRLTDVASKLGFVYTRYADDLSFSGDGEAANKVGKLLYRVRDVVKSEGFNVHPDKTRVLRKGRHQEVTGLVVNGGVGVPRKTLRKFRALLFQIEKDGPEGKHWNGSPDVLTAIAGYANFVLMVDAEKGGKLKARVAAILETHGHTMTPRTPAPSAAPTRGASSPSPAFGGSRTSDALPMEAEIPSETPVSAPTTTPPVEPIAPIPIDTPEEGGEEGGEDGKKWWKLW